MTEPTKKKPEPPPPPPLKLGSPEQIFHELRELSERVDEVEDRMRNFDGALEAQRRLIHKHEDELKGAMSAARAKAEHTTMKEFLRALDNRLLDVEKRLPEYPAPPTAEPRRKDMPMSEKTSPCPPPSDPDGGASPEEILQYCQVDKCSLMGWTWFPARAREDLPRMAREVLRLRSLEKEFPYPPEKDAWKEISKATERGRERARYLVEAGCSVEQHVRNILSAIVESGVTINEDPQTHTAGDIVGGANYLNELLHAEYQRAQRKQRKECLPCKGTGSMPIDATRNRTCLHCSGIGSLPEENTSR